MSVLPFVSQTDLAIQATARIIADDSFKAGLLPEILGSIERSSDSHLPRFSLARAKAIIRAREAESKSMAASEGGDKSALMAEAELKSALALSPADSYLWVLLYHSNTSRKGFDLQGIQILRQSYVAGPHEGWVSLRRNRLALAIFQYCDKSMRAYVVSEFEEMVKSDFIDAAAVNLVGVGWRYREQLLASFASIDLASKERLVRRVAFEGIQLTIPGVPTDERPWRW